MNAVTRKGICDCESQSLFSARQELHEHLNAIAIARTAADQASVPATRLRDRLRGANDELSTAESALSAVDIEVSTAMRAAAEAGGEIETLKKDARRVAETAVEDARRMVASLQSAIDNCADGEGSARRALHDMVKATDGFLLNVIVEEFSDALGDLVAVRDEDVAAATKVDALRELLGERGRGLHAGGSVRGIDWLRAAERASTARNKLFPAETTPAGVMSALARWRVALSQLSSDATATG
jgi:hypothetical protein